MNAGPARCPLSPTRRPGLTHPLVRLSDYSWCSLRSMNTDHELFTRKETATRLRISVSTLSRLAKSGDIRTVRVGRAVLIPATEIERIKEGRPLPAADDSPLVQAHGGTYPPTPSMLATDPDALDSYPHDDETCRQNSIDAESFPDLCRQVASLQGERD